MSTSYREFAERTGKCRGCGHPAVDHHRNQCHHVRDRQRCECHACGPDDWEAGDAWNAFMGRNAS